MFFISLVCQCGSRRREPRRKWSVTHSVLQTRLYSNLTHSKARGGEVLPKDDQPSGSRPIRRAVVLVLAVVGLIVVGRSPGPNKEKKCR